MNIIKLIITALVGCTLNSFVLKAQHNHGGSGGNRNHIVTSDNSQTIKGGNHSFKVDGNCEACKKRIETAAFAVKGVKTADWNTETHFLTVNLKARTDLEDVYQAVAKAGHDNKKYQTANKTYNTLPMCCQYRKK